MGLLLWCICCIIYDSIGNFSNKKSYMNSIKEIQNKNAIRSENIIKTFKSSIKKAFGVENEIEKAEFDTKERKKLAKKKEAEPDGSYPIRNESDLSNAIQAYGRSKDKSKTKAWIKKRAKELGKESMLPEKWED
jgi:regulator of sirC expression with transglutaminase-like and TPR domain